MNRTLKLVQIHISQKFGIKTPINAHIPSFLFSTSKLPINSPPSFTQRDTKNTKKKSSSKAYVLQVSLEGLPEVFSSSRSSEALFLSLGVPLSLSSSPAQSLSL